METLKKAKVGLLIYIIFLVLTDSVFSQREIAKRMQVRGYKISTFMVKQLLKKHSFGRRKVLSGSLVRRSKNIGNLNYH